MARTMSATLTPQQLQDLQGAVGQGQQMLHSGNLTPQQLQDLQGAVGKGQQMLQVGMGGAMAQWAVGWFCECGTGAANAPGTVLSWGRRGIVGQGGVAAWKAEGGRRRTALGLYFLLLSLV